MPDDTTVLSDAERADRLDKLQGIMDLMRPAVQADGGDLVLVRADVESGVIEVQLQGACSSCAVSSATLSGGVERILREPVLLGDRGRRWGWMNTSASTKCTAGWGGTLRFRERSTGASVGAEARWPDHQAEGGYWCHGY